MTILDASPLPPGREGSARSADLSVVICSLNGAAGVHRCLHALARQSGGLRLDVVVVDDGSADDTGAVARSHGATVVRHDINRGLAAARNSGVRAASAEIVAFLDDDCEPQPHWALRLLEGYGDDVTGVGGVVVPKAPDGYMSGYLQRHNPLRPLEMELARSGRLPYRFYLYLRRQWAGGQPQGARDVYSFVGANMSFRRQALLDIGLFDERFRFGAEELDLCMRLRSRSARLILLPGAQVAHHFAPSLPDTLRRSRAYGRGSARLWRKWPSVSPTIFPAPLVELAVLTLSVRFPDLIAAVAVVPHVLFPGGLRNAATHHRPASMLDAYVELAQEACEDAGFLEGWWRFRHLAPEPAIAAEATGLPLSPGGAA